MIKLDIADGQFLITARPTERELVKQINGIRADGSAQWRAPLRWAIYVDAASTVRKYQGEITDAAKQWGAAEGRRVNNLVERKHATGVARKLGNVELFATQAADADWLTEFDSGSGLVFSDMRTGKTYTVLELVRLTGPDAFPLLVVCPPGITFEWDNGLAQALPDRTRVVLSNGMTAKQRKSALAAEPEIVVIGYNNLPKHSKIAYYGGLSKEQRAKEIKQDLYSDKELNTFGFKTIIGDEAHNAKAPKSQQTRALWALGDKADRRIAMTGTPTSKKIADNFDYSHSNVDISDMWALFRFVYPLDFPGKSKFMSKYLRVENNYFGIAEVKGLNPENEKLWARVFEPMYLRRLRSIDTVKDQRRIPVELSKKERKAYTQMATEYMAVIGGELEIAADTMSLRHKLIEICNSESKTAALVEWLGESEDKAVVFTTRIPAFNAIREALETAKIRHLVFPGGLNDVQKKAIVDRFRDDETARVIVCAIKATNAGIDFSAARRTAYFGIADDSVHMLQSEDRAMGPTQTSSSYELAYFVAKDTIEEDILTAFTDKAANLKVLFNDPKWIQEHLHA